VVSHSRTTSDSAQDGLASAPPTARGEEVVASDRIPSLDGLRALSIALVMIGHAVGTAGAPEWRLPLVSSGVANLGVQVFFVISGLLITTLLDSENSKTGGVDLLRFYFRRTFRIMPPYYAVLLVLLILSSSGVISVNGADAWHAVTYTSNYQPDRSWNVGHFWSLGVEEQFYLLWPALLLWAGWRRGAAGAMLAVMLIPVVRSCSYVLWPSYRPYVGNSFETTADALAAGCVLALAGRHNMLPALWLKFRHWQGTPFLAVALVALPLRWYEYPSRFLTIGWTVVIVASAMLVDWCVHNPSGTIGKLLNSSPMRAVGVRSYSIYLWQQLFIDHRVATWWTAFPMNILLSLAAGATSYVLIERPTLRLRSRLERRWFRRQEMPKLRVSE
jgi:peptidoglycan/LPS O-acetylase OafA/YrhL